MHYQPKVELATGKIVGAEALLRWEHAVYGTQPTGGFIPIAEESGLIVDIGAWALRHVARFAVRVNRGRPNPLAFSVNVSQLQFRRGDVAELLRTILEQTDTEPSWLMLELTESLLADNSPAMIGTLRELRAMGVGLSVDDFGIGYSSLSRLEAFPISEFKIDRSFVSQVDQNRSKHVIVDAMIRLGKELQISVVAEGTETKDEVSVLRKLGCPYAQGYFFGRPTPEANLFFPYPSIRSPCRPLAPVRSLSRALFLSLSCFRLLRVRPCVSSVPLSAVPGRPVRLLRAGLGPRLRPGRAWRVPLARRGSLCPRRARGRAAPPAARRGVAVSAPVASAGSRLAVAARRRAARSLAARTSGGRSAPRGAPRLAPPARRRPGKI